MYFQHTNQKLNMELASNIVSNYDFFSNEKLDTATTSMVFNNIKIVNPSVESYVLDMDGRILFNCNPTKKLYSETVLLDPIAEFMKDSKGDMMVRGNDPRQMQTSKVFSAAKIYNQDKHLGYLYVILGNEKYDNIAEPLLRDYILQIGMETLVITLVGALVIGLIVIWLLTRNLRKIIQTVQKFEAGDLNARVQLDSKGGELTPLANTFNHMADTIVKNIEELQAVDNLRKELIANVSHDLRTPLSIIHGYVETLIIKTKTVSADARDRYLNIILNSTERLKKLVAELFELSKLETGQIQVNKEPFFLAELVQDIYHKYQLLAQKKDIKLNPILLQNTSLVNGDVALIERVLHNLIDNAVKHTPEGESISIELLGGKKDVEFKIRNTGIGIPNEDLPKIFERYYKSEKTENEPHKGSGLGLAIVKGILNLHETSIAVKSKVKEFTQFSFKLPAYQTNG